MNDSETNFTSHLPPTFAIVSRFMTMDLPYMAQWFEHYLRLGISKFYLYYIDAEERLRTHDAELESVLGFLREKVALQKIPQEEVANSNDIFWMRPFPICETFLLHIDSDEFLWLNGGREGETLFEFVQANPCYYFSWLMCPSPRRWVESMQSILDDAEAPKYMILEGRKAMGRVSKIKFSQLDTHRFDVQEAFRRNFVSRVMTEPYCLIHFSYRGIYDCYFKLYHQKMKTHDDAHLANKGTFLDRRVRTFPLREIPSRILCYLGEVCNRNPKAGARWRLGLQSTTDAEMLHRLLAEEGGGDKLSIFVARVEALLQMRIYQNILLPPHGIKHHLKHLALFSKRVIAFS